jgi:hypothetical protein
MPPTSIYPRFSPITALVSRQLWARSSVQRLAEQPRQAEAGLGELLGSYGATRLGVTLIEGHGLLAGVVRHGRLGDGVGRRSGERIRLPGPVGQRAACPFGLFCS